MSVEEVSGTRRMVPSVAIDGKFTNCQEVLDFIRNSKEMNFEIRLQSVLAIASINLFSESNPVCLAFGIRYLIMKIEL